MLKRNEGYALSYVLVVLLVLCGIAIAVMSISLNNLKNQQASIDRMVDKYAAQGMVEQVVAQLENGSDFNDLQINDPNISCESISDKYRVVAKTGNDTTVTVEFTLTAIEDDEGNTIGHKVEYLSYDVSYTSPNEGGGE